MRILSGTAPARAAMATPAARERDRLAAKLPHLSTKRARSVNSVAAAAPIAQPCAGRTTQVLKSGGAFHEVGCSHRRRRARRSRVIAGGTPALAADMSPIAPRPAVSSYIPAQFFWTGFYIGAGIGGSWDRATFIDPFAGRRHSPRPRPRPRASWSAAYRASITKSAPWSWASRPTSPAPGPRAPSLDSANNTLSTSVFWTASITGRLGMAFDRVLVYGKGGAAFDYDRDTVMLPIGTTAVGSLYRVGLDDRRRRRIRRHRPLDRRLEYDYLRFPSKALTFQGTATTPPNTGFVRQHDRLEHQRDQADHGLQDVTGGAVASR